MMPFVIGEKMESGIWNLESVVEAKYDDRFRSGGVGRGHHRRRGCAADGPRLLIST